jgi:signal transduction histidine kinase
MPFGQLTRAPRRVLTLFLIVTLIPVAALGVLSWKLLEQDQELEAQRLHDRLEKSAEIVAAALRQRLADESARFAKLENDPQELPDDTVLVTFDSEGIRAQPPGRVLYGPELPATGGSRPGVFDAGDALEYQGNYEGAIGAYRALTGSNDLHTRTEAWVRLARSYRNNQQLQESLAAYRELERFGPMNIAGTPVDLLARERQCDVLGQLGLTAELMHAARDLNTDFESGHWLLDRASYELYLEDAPRRFPSEAQPLTPSPDQLALTQDVNELWTRWQSSPPGESHEAEWRSLWIGDRSVIALERASGNTLSAFVVGPGYLESQWKDVWEKQGVNLSLTDTEKHPVFGPVFSFNSNAATRRAEDTRLPWTIQVAGAHPDADSAQITTRRRLLSAGLALMALLTLLGGYFTLRAARREFAVSRLQSDFVSAVSHEFRTPLTALRHMTELLANNTVLTDDRRRQYYTVMARETERLHRLIEGLLAFGRMEAGRMPQTLEAVDPVELTQTAVAEFESSLGENHHAHRVEFTANGLKPQASTIRANREALSRAIRNLLENAVKYSPNSPIVGVHLSQQGNCVAIHVHDDGFGIPAEEQNTIFEKFVRGAASKALNVSGTGIGLAMTQHIVRTHGGKVVLDSAPGRGTTFTIQLPMADREDKG